ncbi:MAG: DUF1285 domain-containing protein [Alphaproteobacteria bacterium]|nr:DUF1285 domain-containing protein [Alphaproteobacteria bacterium]
MTSQSEDHTARPRIRGLEDLLRAAGALRDAPVEQWDPPYCGDIGLAIAADGTWVYQGSAIRRPKLVKLFARVLRRDDDGRYFLVTPTEKVDVTVADAPFLAVEMEARGEGREQTLIFRTNVDDVVMCGADHRLYFVEEPGPGGFKPYVRVRGRLEALVVRAITYELFELVEADAMGRPGIWSGGRFFRVEPAADV